MNQDDANTPETVEVSASPADAEASVAVSNCSKSAIRYATDAEVDGAMERIFEKHDLLFAELAK